jgi:hypothetical protein
MSGNFRKRQNHLQKVVCLEFLDLGAKLFFVCRASPKIGDLSSGLTASFFERGL